MSGEIAAVSTAAGTVTGALAALMSGTHVVLLYPLLKLRPGQAQRAFLPPHKNSMPNLPRESRSTTCQSSGSH